MRRKKTIINVFSSILFEIATLISAFLLPRLIIGNFGSNVNGITQAVTQFVSYISLLTAGISSVTTAALYRPIAEENKNDISSIIKSTEIFIRKISKIFLVMLVLLSFILPLFLLDEFDYIYSSTLVFILGIGTFGNYYFGITYRMVLNADQKQYVNRFIQTILLIINTLITVLMINYGAKIHIVKLVSAMIFLINPLFIYVYVLKKYQIDKNVTANNEALNQRWDAFYLHIANFASDNIDLTLLFLFTSVSEVSVYSVYILVYGGVRALILTLMQGSEAAFGNMIAKEQKKSIMKNFEMFELIVNVASVILYVSMGLLINSFVNIYTANIADIEYERYFLGIALSILGFTYAIRMPYELLTKAAGHFKETKKAAFIETVINITLSIGLVIPFGVNGLIIGTLIASIFRLTFYTWYTSKHLLNRNIIYSLKRYIITIITVSVTILIIVTMNFKTPENFSSWIKKGLLISSISLGVTLIINSLFYYKEFVNIYSIFKNIFSRSNKERRID